MEFFPRSKQHNPKLLNAWLLVKTGQSACSRAHATGCRGPRGRANEPMGEQHTAPFPSLSVLASRSWGRGWLAGDLVSADRDGTCAHRRRRAMTCEHATDRGQSWRRRPCHLHCFTPPHPCVPNHAWSVAWRR